MPSTRFVASGIVVAGLTGCLDEPPPAPDVAHLHVMMRWASDNSRSVDISLTNADIPCTEVEHGLLGESAVKCESAPWTLHIDGVEIVTTPVTCWSAHDGLFGYVDKSCEGGKALATVPDGGEDVEIVAATDGQENRMTLHGVRRTHTFVEERLFQGGQPAIVRVQDLELTGDLYTTMYNQAGTTIKREAARRVSGDKSQLELEPFGLAAGVYDVRVLALASRDGATIAVPIEGPITIAP